MDVRYVNLINKRYKVLKSIKQNRFVSSYLVADEKLGLEELQLNIINSEYLSENLLDYYIKEFQTLTTIDSPKHIKLYDFDIIKYIDNKTIDKPQYFYTNEFIENDGKLIELINSLDEKEQLDLIVRLCQSINYLHLRGFNYGDININNIYIANFDFKFKDIATKELEKYDFWYVKDNQIIFKSPEILEGMTPTNASDIYSLGVLFAFICKKEVTNNLIDIREDIESCEVNDNRLLCRLAPVIEKMTDANIKNRYVNISEIIKDVNSIFGTSYSPHVKEEIEKINFNTKLVGRDYELNNILNLYNSKVKLGLSNKFVILHGEYGIGKTKFIKEIERLMLLNSINVYSSYSLEISGEDRNKGFYEIIKKLTYECDAETLERYERELVKFIPELAQKKEVIPNEALDGDKEKLRIISNICDFIHDLTKGKPIVLIIDNIHRANDFSIEILEHLFLRSRNLMVIVSYCDGEYSSKNKLSEFLTKYAGKPNITDIPLRGLSNEDSVTMIQDLLRMPARASKFSGTIFSKTYGNPLFMEETLKNLLANKYIFIDEQTGVWDSTTNDYSKLPIPINMEQAVLAQVKDIDELSKDILKSLSIFNAGIPEEVITNIIEVDKTILQESIGVLEAKGIICKKIEDSGFVYDFTNRILKNIMNDKLDENYRISMHEVAASLLERKYEEGIENKEELIYHLEKSGQKEKVIKYCLDNADKMEAFKNRGEAINNLKRVLSMLIDEERDIRKIEVLIRIGNIYEEEGSRTEAIDYFLEAEKLAFSQGAYKYQIDALNKIAQVYFLKNEINKTQSYIFKVQKLLNNKDNLSKYIEGYLQCMELKVRVMHLKREYDKASEVCENCISLCGDNYYKFKGLFYKNLGNVYLNTSKIDDAVKCYKESSSYFEKVNYSEGVVLCINNLAVVYGDYFQDNEMAINYFLEMKEISERNHIINYEIMALTNLASSYCYDFDYVKALQYFLESLEKSKKIDYESNIFYCYNYLCFVYVKLENYKEAYKYFKLAKKELEDYPDQGKEVGTYYQVHAEFLYALGDEEKAKDFIEKALNVFKEQDSLAKWDCEVLLEYITLQSLNSKIEISESAKRIKNLIGNYKVLNTRKNILYDAAMILFDKGCSEEARDLFYYEDEASCGLKSSILELKKGYLEAVLSNEEDPSLLIILLNKCKGDKNKNIYWKVCYNLGNYYLAKEDYFHSVNFYFEAADVIKMLTLQLPEHYRIKFISSNRMLRPFERIGQYIKYSDYSQLSDLKEEYVKLTDISELNKIFNYEGIDQILHNKNFIKSARKTYNSYLPMEIRNANDIIKNLYSNPIKNLDIIAKYLASVTLATRSVIIIDGFEKSYYVIASNDGSDSIPSNKLIFEKVKAGREPLLIKENLLEFSSSEINIMLQGLKAALCIPIIMKSQEGTFNNNLIKGYIYLESDRIINNFNYLSVMKCNVLSRLVGISIERYQLQMTSSIDKLTGVLTRKSLEEALIENIDKAEAFGTIFSIIMMDMDHFKEINDRFGHQTGDEVLKKACSIIRANLSKDTVFGRYGGEEFIILLPDVDAKNALLIAENLRYKVDSAKILGNKTDITVSMGISTFPHHAEWKEELIEKADQALYISKELGRNRCKVWTSEFANKTKGRNKLSGIVSGNMVQDSRNVLVMVDIIELIKQNINLENKIYNILGRIIEITESEFGWFLTVEEDKIKDVYSRKIFSEEWIDINNFNKEIINSVITKKQGVYMTDWDESANDDLISGMPEWNSVLAVPLIKNDDLKGILYLSVPVKKKEFKFDEFNFVNTLGELTAAIL